MGGRKEVGRWMGGRWAGHWDVKKNGWEGDERWKIDKNSSVFDALKKLYFKF